jgi:isochorismate synthase
MTRPHATDDGARAPTATAPNGASAASRWHRDATADRLAALIGQGISQAGIAGPVLVTLTEPRPGTPPLELFERAAALAADRTYWEQPSDGLALAGVGTAVELTAAEGAGRFTAIGRSWSELMAHAIRERTGTPAFDAWGTGPLLLGGFSFDPEPRPSPTWRRFPAARLVVPRFLLASTPAGQWLTISVLVGADDDAASVTDAVIGERTLLFAEGPGPRAEGRAAGAHSEGRAAGAHSEGRAAGARPTITELRDPDEWKRAVAAAAAAVRAGSLEKAVLARAVRLRAEAPLDVHAALHRLRTRYPACYIFAFAHGEATFLGATPERLVRLDGREVRATSLAGSIRRGETAEDDARLARTLLASAKDRVEHELVVRGLRETLAPLCDEIGAPAEPSLLSMPNVHHLATAVVARLRDGHRLLDLLERVHPTPAVAGLPRDVALALIEELEEMDRGWYAAPVGWVAPDGSGEFAVALRAAVVAGGDATLFAGCGIVGDSDPDEEYAESWLKLRPMLAALGGAEP